MKRAPMVGLVAMLAVSVLGVGPAAAGDAPVLPDEASAAALAAVSAAAEEVDDLLDEVASGGIDSEDFAERHAELAAKHAAHPGNAAAVHEALSTGVLPSSVKGAGTTGHARRDEVRERREARDLENGGPGRGRGVGHGRAGGHDDEV